MPTYITLFQWTQKGIENVKDSPKRLDRAKEAFKAGEDSANERSLRSHNG